ncbi:MAG: sulfur oxidation c-type cytochrome SoxX [Gammaproteobacteria bacterium]|nr:sulfur oxidation c-type cytochrome SoxX [Gammaproteobacteria bacterium]
MIKKTVMALCLGVTMTLGSAGGGVAFADGESVNTGKKVAFNRQKGNCLSCHMMDDGDQPGTQGPPLIAMKLRFPNREDLRARVYKPLEFNPNSIMPPFGLHNILSDGEIDAIVDYLLTL